MSRLIYEGSVKNVRQHTERTVIFEYTDAFSVFDWGRMPDLIPHKGAALAATAAFFFRALENRASWSELLGCPRYASFLEAAGPLRSRVQAIASHLSREGLETHFKKSLESGKIEVEAVHIPKLSPGEVLGATLYATFCDDAQPHPPGYALIPIEFVFRFEFPEGSSFLKRAERAAEIGMPWIQGVTQKTVLDFPVLETFTKLEPTDRWLPIAEALAISKLPPTKLDEVLIKTALTAFFLREKFQEMGVLLQDGKLEWAYDPATGKVLLVDAIGPDELRLIKDGVPLSKELLRIFYRRTRWFAEMERAKVTGSRDWQTHCSEPVPRLDSDFLDKVTDLYLSIAHGLAAVLGQEITDGLVKRARPLTDVVRDLEPWVGGTR